MLPNYLRCSIQYSSSYARRKNSWPSCMCTITVRCLAFGMTMNFLFLFLKKELLMMIWSPSRWIGVKYVAGGSSFLGAMFNCYVHVLMYTYYFLAAIGPTMRPYLWWKKYLTIIQMLQFLFALIMGINALRVGCDFPMWMQYSANAYMVSFLLLFGRYFYREYCEKRKKIH